MPASLRAECMQMGVVLNILISNTMQCMQRKTDTEMTLVDPGHNYELI